MNAATRTTGRPVARKRPGAPAFALSVAVLATAAGTLLSLHADADVSVARVPAELPPLRRVLMTREGEQGMFEQVNRGVMRSLPRDEFEEKVNRASRAVEALRHPPKLAEARYRARLIDGSLEGTGQWKVVHSGDGAGLLPLQPLNLALRQPRFENRDALIADFDGKTPSLLLDRPGDHAVAIEWSARSEERPEGLHFDLKLPVSPVAVLEIDLPVDRIAAAVDGSLVSGPHTAEAADRRLWRVSCGGRPGVDLWVRRAGPAARPTLLLVRQFTTQTLEPEGLDAKYQFDVELLHREVDELQLDFDPELRPFEVVIAGLEGWEVRPPAKPGAPALLVIRLREPLRQGRESLVVHCLAPFGAPRPAGSAATPTAPGLPDVDWKSPGMRLAGAVSRGETLTLVIYSDLRLDGLDTGDFRLSGSSVDAAAGRRGPAQRLTLVGGGLAGTGGAPRRPAARLKPHAVEFRARHLTWWQPAADPPSLTVQIGCEVERGRLFQLPVVLPAGWDVDRVEMSPAGLLRGWGVRPTAGDMANADSPAGATARQTLTIDFQQPLTSGPRESGGSALAGVSALFGRPRVPTLTVRLVPKGPVGAAGEDLPFPDVLVPGARLREGVLAIGFDTQIYQATLNASTAEAELEDDGPWGRQIPDAVYQYRGGPIDGTLVLRPRPPQVRARCLSDVYLPAGRAAMNTRLVLEAEAGRPDSLDISLSAPSDAPPGQAPGQVPGQVIGQATARAAGHAPGHTAGERGGAAWQWTVVPAEKGAKADNAVKSFERLHAAEAAEVLGVLGCGDPLGVAALLAARPPGERWRLTLARPLHPRVPLVLQAARGLEPNARSWDVPLPSVTGARRMEGEVTLHLAGAEFVLVETAGLQEAPAVPPAPGRPRLGTSWRTFRYGDSSVSLVLRGRGTSVDRAAEAEADQAHLITYLGSDGAARHHFAFRMSNWTQRTLPIRLPPGARPVALRARGHPVALPAGPVGSEPGVVDLPVPRLAGGAAAEASFRYEVVYDTDSPANSAWKPWEIVDAPAPVLPVPALTFHRIWRLPADVDPVPDGRLLRLPGIGRFTGNAVPRVLSERFLLSTPLSDTLARHPAAEGQAEGLSAAAAGLRPKAGGRVVRLRELVTEIAGGFLNGRLVVDGAALSEAGVGAESLLAIDPPDGSANQNPPWESLGLSAVKAGPASLLTSTARARQWSSASDPPDLVVAAVAEALANGHDATGNYRIAPDWIRHAAEGAREEVAEALPDPGPSLSPWTEWEPLAGVADDSTLVVVRRSHVLAGGVLLTALVGALLWTFQRRDLVLIACLATAGLAVLWLPSALRPLAWLPLLAGVVAALAGYLIAVARGRSPSRSPSRAPLAATVLLVALAAAGGPGTAQESAPWTVFLIPDNSGERQKETVLAPPELLDRLDALARATPATSGPVLLTSAYEGKAVGSVAEFTSVFEAYCPVDGTAPLTLALEGVYLDGDAIVDGARELPEALPTPGTGFSVPLHGAGRHKVELRFRVPIATEDGGRGVRFGAPRASQSRLRMALPPGSSALQALVKHGSQRVTAEADGPVLEAELGRVLAPLHVRWMQEVRPANMEVREAYLWDLNAEGDALTGWLHYHVVDGSVSAVVIDLPAGLEAQAVEARRVGPGEPVRLRDWRVSGSAPTRTLEADLSSSTAGAFLIGLTLVPTAPPGPDATLLLPGPHARVSAERSHVAYRARGLKATLEGTRWLTGGPVEAFAPIWPESIRPDLASRRDDVTVYAATFHREAGQEPALRVRLAPAAPRLRVERQEITARVSARHAELEAQLRIATPDGEPVMLTCRLRPENTTVSAVSGPGVRRWAQTGDELVIWFERDAAERRGTSLLEIAGWLPFNADVGQLEIPSLRVERATSEPALVRIVPEPGLTLTPTGLGGLRAGPASEAELTFVAERPDYVGSCEVRAGAAGAAVRVLTVAEVRERRLTFRSTVDFAPSRGDLGSAMVRLRNWDGEDVKLEVDKALPVRQRERRRAASDRTWSLELRPGVTGLFRLTLSGSMPAGEAVAGVPMPEVSVPGSVPIETLVVVAGPDLSAEGADGLTTAESPGLALKDWPAEADHLRQTGGQVWKVARDEWALRLRPRGGADAGPIRVLLADHTLAVADGHHWLHEAVYWVEHGANTDLNVLLLKPGTVVAVAVDGVDVAPLQPGRRQLWLPLPGRPGVRAVRVRWRYDAPADPLDRPLLQTPAIEGAVGGAAVWTTYVPAGFEPVAGNGPAPEPGLIHAAAAALFRAEAQLQISVALSEATGEGQSAALAAAQRRFYAYCRHAEQSLQLADTGDGGAGDAEIGPTGESLPRWLRSLLEDNGRLASEHNFEEIRAEAEHRSDSAASRPRLAPEEGEPPVLTGPGLARVRGPLPDTGTPAYLSSMESSAAPVLSIRPRQEHRLRELLRDSALWLALLAAATAIALSPRLRGWLQPFWPEPLLLLGAVAYYRSGSTPVAVLFLLLGAGGRLLTLGAGFRNLFRPRRRVALAAANSGVGSSVSHGSGT